MLIFWLPQAVLAITIQPVRAHVPIEPGESKSFSFNVINETDGTLFLQSDVKSFLPADEFGNAKVDYDSREPWHDWFTVRNPNVALPAKQGFPAIVDITVPDNAAPGGYYAAILWGESPGAGNFGVKGNIAFLVMLEVGGDLIEDGEFVGVSYQGSRGHLTSFPTTFNVHVKNTGNTHLQPSGNIKITNRFNWPVAKLHINSAGGFILPNSSRVFSVGWENPLLLLNDLATGEVSLAQALSQLRALFIAGDYTATINLNLTDAISISEQINFKVQTRYPYLIVGLVVFLILLTVKVTQDKKRSKSRHGK